MINVRVPAESPPKRVPAKRTMQTPGESDTPG